MIVKHIIFFGENVTFTCDGKCHKAWGVNSRPRVSLSHSEDDFAWLADGELPDAPVDPGTYEGGQAKPVTDYDKPNKWCVRECERSWLSGGSQKNFDARVNNLKSRDSRGEA